MKTKYFLLICFASFQLPVLSQSAQQLRIDSLRKVLPNLNDTARVDCLNELATLHWSLVQVNPKDSMYHYAVKANQKAVKIQYQYGQAISLLHMAQYEMFAKNNLTVAKRYIDQSILIGETSNNPKIIGRAYVTRAELPGEDIDHSLECFTKARKYFQKAGDKEGELEVTAWFCSFYARKGKYDEGFDYCDKCVQLTKLISSARTNWNTEVSIKVSLMNMAGVFEIAGDYQSSMGYLKQCDRYAIEHGLGWDMDIMISNIFLRMEKYDSASLYWHRWERDYISYHPGHQAWGNTILAEIYLQTKRYEEALKLLESSNAIFKKANYTANLLSKSMLLTSKVLVKKKNWNKALTYATEGFRLAKKENIHLSVIDGYELLSEINHARGENDKAYFYLRRYTTLKDSVFNRQFLWRLNNYKKASENEKKKASIELLNKDNRIKSEQLEQETLMRKFLLAGLLACVLIGIFIARNLVLKRKNEEIRNEQLKNELTVDQLESQKKQAELKQISADLEMKALRAQMNPHFIFNCLSSINSFILKNESEQASDYLTSFSRLIRMVLNNSRRALVTLEEEMEMMCLYLEMERLRFKNSFDYSITYKNEIDTSSICIPPLLVQPFAENSIQQCLMNKEGSGQLDIVLELEENILVCTITDNGIGRKRASEMKASSINKSKSLGIQVTEERLALLNVQSISKTYFTTIDLYDHDEEAAGTQVVLKIPVEDTLKEFDIQQI